MYDEFEEVLAYETAYGFLVFFPCGCVEEMTEEEFYEMIETDEDYDDDFEDEYEEVDAEVDSLLETIAGEIEDCAMNGDYESVEILSRAYANLYNLL